MTTDKTYMTLSALKTFVTNVFTGDAGVTITCSQNTNDNYYPLESEISIVGKQYQTFTPPAPSYKEIPVLTYKDYAEREHSVITDNIIGEYHFYTKFFTNIGKSRYHPIFVVGNGTPPTTNQISVIVKYRHKVPGKNKNVRRQTVSNSSMNYNVAPDGVKYVFDNEKYDWYGHVGYGDIPNDYFFDGFE